MDSSDAEMIAAVVQAAVSAALIRTDTVNRSQAAEILGVGINRVSALIESGAIPAAMHGREFMMTRATVLRYHEEEVARQTEVRMRRRS